MIISEERASNHPMMDRWSYLWLATFLTVGVTQYQMLNAPMPSSLPVYLITVAVTPLPYALPYMFSRSNTARDCYRVQ